MSSQNHKVVLKRTLQGIPDARDFALETAPLPEPTDGMFRIRHLYIALDPWQRSALAGRHAVGGSPFQRGDTPPAEVIGTVDASRHRDYREGDYVRLMGG